MITWKSISSDRVSTSRRIVEAGVRQRRAIERGPPEKMQEDEVRKLRIGDRAIERHRRALEDDEPAAGPDAPRGLRDQGAGVGLRPVVQHRFEGHEIEAGRERIAPHVPGPEAQAGCLRRCGDMSAANFADHGQIEDRRPQGGMPPAELQGEGAAVAADIEQRLGPAKILRLGKGLPLVARQRGREPHPAPRLGEVLLCDVKATIVAKKLKRSRARHELLDIVEKTWKQIRDVVRDRLGEGDLCFDEVTERQHGAEWRSQAERVPVEDDDPIADEEMNESQATGLGAKGNVLQGTGAGREPIDETARQGEIEGTGRDLGLQERFDGEVSEGQGSEPESEPRAWFGPGSRSSRLRANAVVSSIFRKATRPMVRTKPSMTTPNARQAATRKACQARQRSGETMRHYLTALRNHILAGPASIGLALMGLGLAASCLPAKAADRAAPALPIFVADPDWNGFYAGGHMGIAAAQTNYDYAGDLTGNLTNHTRIGRIHGSAPGVYGGYNYQFGPVVIGAEGDATFTDGMFRLNGANLDFLQSSYAITTGSGRLGYLATPTTLVYGKLGYSVIQLSGQSNFGQPFRTSISGVQYAAGVESLLDDHVMLRLEAAYTSANHDLVLNQGFDHYRPSFLWVDVGLAFKLDPLPQIRSHAVATSYVTHTPNWTTVWAAGNAGIASGQVTRYDPMAGLIGPYNDLHFTGGFAAGGDVQLFKYLVVGAAFDDLILHSTFDDDLGVGLVPPLVHRFAEIDRIYSFTGRAGVLVTPSTLLYGKAGYARMRFVPEAAYFQAVNPTARFGVANIPSLQAGLGTEAVVADHVAVRIEGLYTRAEQAMVIDGVQPGAFRLQPSTFTATAGLVVKY